MLKNLSRELDSLGYKISLVVESNLSDLRFFKKMTWIERQYHIKINTAIVNVCHNRQLKKQQLLLNFSPRHLGGMLAAALDIPCVTRISSQPRWWHYPLPNHKELAEKLIHSLSILSDQLISISSAIRSNLLDCYKVSSKRIPEGCDAAEFMPSEILRKRFRKRYNIKDNTTAIGVLANFNPQKRHDVVLEALKNFHKKQKKYLCFFMGTSYWPEMIANEKHLKEVVASYGLKNHVLFTGFLKNVAEAINGMDLMLFPFEDEGFGLSLIESMACEKPVIAADSGAFSEIIKDGSNGILTRYGRAKDLCRALLSVLNEPEKSKRMGEESRKQLLLKYPIQKTAKSYDKHLKHVLTKYSKSKPINTSNFPKMK